jgi:hypothetical protein
VVGNCSVTFLYVYLKIHVIIITTYIGVLSVELSRIEHCRNGGVIGHYAAAMSSALW